MINTDNGLVRKHVTNIKAADINAEVPLQLLTKIFTHKIFGNMVNTTSCLHLAHCRLYLNNTILKIALHYL